MRTGKAPEVVDPDLVMQLETPAQALHPPPEPILFVRLHAYTDGNDVANYVPNRLMQEGLKCHA